MAASRELKRPFVRQELRTRPEPEFVAHIIKVVNGVPEPQADPGMSGGSRDLLSEALEKTEPESPNSWGAPGVACIRNIVDSSWGSDARAYVLASEEFNDMLDLYRSALGFRDLLYCIAEQNSKSVSENVATGTYSLPVSAKLMSTLTLQMRPVTTKGPPSGAEIVPSGPLRQCLNELELSRIKRCAYGNCRNLFWAGRLDRSCCSEVCRNAYRQKMHRDRQRENRPYKKGLVNRSISK